MNAGRPAFSEADAALHALKSQVDHVLVDMHAEATSEKVGMGWHLDGRVTAVVGTHTHVPTADARVLPGGTAYITDVGMTGPRGGVIGVKRELAIEAMVTKMPIKFETSTEDPWLNGVLIRASEPMRADSIEQVLEPRRGSVGVGASSGSPATPAGAVVKPTVFVSAVALNHARRRSARRSRRGWAATERHDHQREEPRDVQVEPVRDPELERDQRRPRRARDLDQSAPPRDERDARAPAPTAAPWTRCCSSAQPTPQPPDRERRAAVELVA